MDIYLKHRVVWLMINYGNCLLNFYKARKLWLVQIKKKILEDSILLHMAQLQNLSFEG